MRKRGCEVNLEEQLCLVIGFAIAYLVLAGKESSSQSRAVSADLPVTKELGYCLKGARFFPLQGMNQLPVTSTVLTSPVAPNPLLPV